MGLGDILPQPTGYHIQGDVLFSLVTEDNIREQFLSKMLNLSGQPYPGRLLCSVLIVRLWAWGSWKGDSGASGHEGPGVRD